MKKKRIVITGAAGVIGTVLRKNLKDSYRLTLLDIVPIQDESSVVINVAKEYSRLKKVFAGNNVVIHLAIDHQGSFRSKNWVPENDLMTWNVYRAAIDSNVKRVIMASSIHAIDYSNRKESRLISPNDLPNPDTPYGAMKVFMEALGKYFARKRGLEVICLRFGGINSEDQPLMLDEPDYFKIWLSHKDCLNLVKRCIEVEAIPQNFAIIFGVSNNICKIHDFKNPVDWIPQDKAELRLIPELQELDQVIENNKSHRNQSVFNHTLLTLAELEKMIERTNNKLKNYLNERVDTCSKKELLCLATLLHDIGKKETIKKEGDFTKCLRHEEKSAEKLKNIVSRFNLSNDERKIITQVVKNHGIIHDIFEHPKENHEEKISEFKKNNPDIFLEIVLITKADILGGHLRDIKPEEFKYKINFLNRICTLSTK